MNIYFHSEGGNGLVIQRTYRRTEIDWRFCAKQLKFHFNKAKENGLSEEELIEVITHLAFYAGWPKAMSAVMVAKELFTTGKSKGCSDG